jgi:ABC-type multidrug transport system fused ATPase/permease subunit
MSTIQPTVEANTSAPELIKRTLHDALELGRAELTLAKKEAVEQARALATSAMLLLAALILFQAAITTLGVLLVLMLHATALGFVVVGAFAALALALGFFGIHQVERTKLHVGQRAKRDAREIVEAVK